MSTLEEAEIISSGVKKTMFYLSKNVDQSTLNTINERNNDVLMTDDTVYYLQ